MICIIGVNEIATAAAITCFHSGQRVWLYSRNGDMPLRYQVTFAEAIHQDVKTVENVTASLLPPELLSEQSGTQAERLAAATRFLWQDRKLPLLYQIDFETAREALQPEVIIDTEPGDPVSRIDQAALVIGLHPGHRAGEHCHLSIAGELNYHLGRICLPGNELPSPAADKHFFNDPFAYCQTPLEGLWVALKSPGEEVRYQEALGKVNDIEIRSPYDGQIWGICHSGRFMPARSSVAQIYQGPASDAYRDLGFREKAIARAMLEAVLCYKQ
ncbi:MAG: hypothetical protein H6628_19110 [Calditrichae bacterium]|nr:hypothetical protein [Calditrichota bacterium]MCB9090413.1 hypothetical protein [Calditrichia bacterium]